MKSYKKFIATVFVLSLWVSLTAATPLGITQGDKKSKPQGPAEPPMSKQMELHNKAAKLPAGPDFYIQSVAGPTVQYSILLTDSDNRSVPGTFISPQIDILEALLLA